MTAEERNNQSIEAHKDIINRFIEADDKQLASELAKHHEEQAAPYVDELDQIIARKHQNGFMSEKDKKRASKLLTILDSIEKDEFESTDEGMQAMMHESSQRIFQKQREQHEARKREREEMIW